jgi:hypothetical protein
MAIGQRIVLNVGVALLAATMTLLPGVPARAAPGCNPIDVFQAAANTAGALTSPACAEASQIGEGAGYVLAGGVVAGLALVQANSGPDSVNKICDALTTGQNDVKNLGDWLAAAGISQDVTSAILTLGGPALSVAECGCQIEQGVSALVSDVSNCACDLLSLVGANCSCSPPPPVQANCALPTTCVPGSSDPACQGGIFALTGNEQDGPTGAFVSTHLGSDPNCGALLYCFCPKPLVPKWTNGSKPGNGNIFGTDNNGMFTCACPDSTRQVGTAGGIPICLCDYTNQPPKVGDTPQEQCPINLVGSCKPNQIVVAGKCVTPCSDPTMGMTPDGACCDPNQVTACGQCCGPGKRPVNGSCVGPGPIQ